MAYLRGRSLGYCYPVGGRLAGDVFVFAKSQVGCIIYKIVSVSNIVLLYLVILSFLGGGHFFTKKITSVTP